MFRILSLSLSVSLSHTHTHTCFWYLQGKELDLFKNQVPGWRLGSTPAGHQSITQEWKAKDDAAAAEISARLSAVAAASGHALSSVSVKGTSVVLELCTPTCAGVTENDFILASQINETDLKDLTAKAKAR
jgi:pterin-4a-carbinolamine dehydratase